MKLLIDFLNIKEWTVENLFGLVQTYGLCIHVRDFEQSYKNWTQFRNFPNHFYFRKPDAYAAFLQEKGAIVVLPEDEEKYQEMFNYLEALQQEDWKQMVEQTIESGPDIDFLNESMKLADIELVKRGSTDFICIDGLYGAVEETYSKNTYDPWKVDFLYARSAKSIAFENFLEFSYLYPFLEGRGEQFRRLKTCKNPDCGKWFVYNRPKQTFCCNDCRHRYNNHIKIKSGYLAEHQRKGRAEKPSIYNY